MKKIIILVQVIGLTLLMACNSGNKGGTADQPYGEKSGIVIYKPMDMMGIKVSRTLYFDDYGMKEMNETTVEGNMSGVEMRQHTIDIRDGNFMYHYELENTTGRQDKASKSCYKTTLTPEMLQQMNVGSLSKELKVKLGFKEDGKETVAGLEGVKYSLAPDSLSPDNRITGVHYKNIPIKLSMGQLEIVADKVELGVKIDAAKFKVPEGYTIIDQPAQQQMPDMPAEAPTGDEPDKK